jgi:hypothetical protein
MATTSSTASRSKYEFEACASHLRRVSLAAVLLAECPAELQAPLAAKVSPRQAASANQVAVDHSVSHPLADALALPVLVHLLRPGAGITRGPGPGIPEGHVWAAVKQHEILNVLRGEGTKLSRSVVRTTAASLSRSAFGYRASTTGPSA